MDTGGERAHKVVAIGAVNSPPSPSRTATAVQYLSLAYTRAKRESDRVAERMVAKDGMQLARRLAEQGDIDAAQECLAIAHLVYYDQRDTHGMQRVIHIEHELLDNAATRAPPRSK